MKTKRGDISFVRLEIIINTGLLYRGTMQLCSMAAIEPAEAEEESPTINIGKLVPGKSVCST